MRHFKTTLQISVIFVVAACLSQTAAPPSEKIVFVRPDPMITTSSSMAMLSADTRGSGTGTADSPKGSVGINSVDNPAMQFHSSSDAKMNLLAFMNPDGTGITDLHVNGFDPSVSPDGARIAFCSLRNDQYSQIYAMNADGSAQKRLTNISTGDACGPVWSHDGKKIAFYQFALPNPSRNPAIWVMDPDGANLKKLTEHAISPSWSPDDRQIAFASNRAGKFQIFAMNSDGSNVRRLTEDKGEDSSPAWAPDGDSILFVSDREGEHPALFLMAADGSQQHRLVFSKRQDFCFPAWSLDGRLIAFSSLNRVATQFITVGEERPRCEMWTGEYQLFTFDADGKLHQLTNTKYMAMKPTFGRLATAH
jgi:TolB protein